MIFFKKKLYNNLIQQKKLYTLNTYNRTLHTQLDNINLIKNKLYTIYIFTQEKDKLYIKEVSGILIKKNKMQNLTNIHLLSLKKYNNIYLSFFKETPNILIKYKI